MKFSTILLSAAVSLSATLATSVAMSASGYDALATQKIEINSTDSAAVLERTFNNVKSILERYKPAFDSGTKILSPLQVGGTADHPTVKITVKKCVAFICKTVSLDAEFTLSDVSGSCDRNALLVADLSRSGSTLTDVYSNFEVAICYRKSADGKGVLDVSARAKQSATYESGLIQQQIFGVLQLQIKPIVKAVNETLEANK